MRVQNKLNVLIPCDVIQNKSNGALNNRKCVITPVWRLMRAGYHTCFHTLYDEKKILCTRIDHESDVRLERIRHHMEVQIQNRSPNGCWCAK